MTGYDRILAVIRSHTQSSWDVQMDVFWNTAEPDGCVELVVSPGVLARIITPPATWWRILDRRRRMAYAVQSVEAQPNGGLRVRCRRTPIFEIERRRLREGAPR
jgi:hypothetical protein